ncbi:MAG: sensor histidine kinase, partial [Acidimicrobiia bacterium]
LTSIIGSLDTASRPELAPESSAARDLLASARRQATRLQRLIEDLLTVSRIDRGSLPLHPEELRLRAFLSDLISAFPWAGDRLALRVEPPDLSVSADPDHLGRILINLVENAGKYAPEGPVEVTARAAGSSFELVVADHGPGISPDQRESAFERFARLERSAIRSHGGTGLGLSIVRALSEAMGGEVTLAETPGGGCTFSVNLPAAPGVRKARAG